MASKKIKDLVAGTVLAPADVIPYHEDATNTTKKITASNLLSNNGLLNTIAPPSGTLAITGAMTISSTTDSTNKDTGALILEGGLGVEKALGIGTNILLEKEANHTISVTTTTTAATAGGNLTIKSAVGATSGTGGLLLISAGDGGTSGAGGQTFISAGNGGGGNSSGGLITIQGGTSTGSNTGGETRVLGGPAGTTGTGGNITITSGTGGSTSGNSGSVTIKSANETGTDASGQIFFLSGTTVSANSGTVSLQSGAVSTSGNSGAMNFNSGNSSTSGNSGRLDIYTGTAQTGNSGLISMRTGASGTLGNTGSFTIATGNATNGTAGNIIITPGTHNSTTVQSYTKISKIVGYYPESTSVASGATITAVQLLGGLIDATGATGNYTLPDTADIITAMGGVQAGTNFEFIFNAEGMTAGNTATLVVGADMTVPSAPAITGGATLTVTQGTQVTAGFKVVFNTATTCKIYRTH